MYLKQWEQQKGWQLFLFYALHCGLLFAVVRLAPCQEKRGRDFAGMIGRMAASGGTGIVLSGAIMIPTVPQLFGTGCIGCPG